MLTATKDRLSTASERASAACYHCGAECLTRVTFDEHLFCCNGCKLVYEILNKNGLCDYYTLQSHPGLGQIKPIRSDKYTYLDDEQIANKLYQFTNGDKAIVTLYIPAIHCSSCMWLLEHLGRLNDGISESRINFTAKEVTIHFSQKKTTLRTIVELLATIGYEPYISLDDAEGSRKDTYSKMRTIKLGIAGFCFGNIMMMSFPEYLSGQLGIDMQFAHLFRYLNVVLSLPVIFFCATEFYSAAWAGIRQRMLNIDAPIVLALFITYTRSIYEILTNTGAGYLDSMSGIVFFMLAGRILQERTYKSLSFTRDYKSYFPIAVKVHRNGEVHSTQLQDLKKDDIVTLHNGEIVPADALVMSAHASIDYSFVTGEASPVSVKQGDIIYAGGKLSGEELQIQIAKPVAGSYLTSLWNHYAFRKDKAKSNDSRSVVHVLSRYFTIILFSLAAITATYWYFVDPAKIITSVSAMLIVACPCALLLAATFTNSNILRILNLNGLFLRDSTVIEQLANTDCIVFDKTGTLTYPLQVQLEHHGGMLSEGEKDLIYAAARQSNHPNSQALAAWLGKRRPVSLDVWQEVPGNGVKAIYRAIELLIGSAAFTGADVLPANGIKASFYVRINNKFHSFYLNPVFRAGIPQMAADLKEQYTLSLLSGDNNGQRPVIEPIFGSNLLFDQQPIDKLKYIEHLQEQGKAVMMLGDGLNDAGALQQSNVGIAVTEDVNNFTPACDAILKADELQHLPRLLRLAKWSSIIINASFVISIIYNIFGLYFAASGQMKPVIAAILMPCSTLSIVIISSSISNLIAWRMRLRLHS